MLKLIENISFFLNKCIKKIFSKKIPTLNNALQNSIEHNLLTFNHVKHVTVFINWDF